MKKSQIIFIGLAVVSAAFFLWAWNRSSVQPPQATTDAGVPYNAATSSALEAKTNSDGWADIEVTPSSLAPSEWSFKVILNAHQELDANLIKAATLTDNRGDKLTPLRWENPDPAAHHQEGTLVFSALPSKPQSITLTINDVGGVATRIFSWQLP